MMILEYHVAVYDDLRGIDNDETIRFMPGRDCRVVVKVFNVAIGVDNRVTFGK